tara:strand:+ start:1898 stop:2026 length:129 start_codon:yes stop_codon:yes gene_type:complete
LVQLSPVVLEVAEYGPSIPIVATVNVAPVPDPDTIVKTSLTA